VTPTKRNGKEKVAKEKVGKVVKDKVAAGLVMKLKLREARDRLSVVVRKRTFG